MDDIKKIIKTAVEFLREGQTFKVGDIRIGVKNNSQLYVTGMSNYSNIDYLTKKIAIDELNNIQSSFREMILLSDELANFSKNKKVRFNLALNSISPFGICYELDEIITWEVKLPD